MILSDSLLSKFAKTTNSSVYTEPVETTAYATVKSVTPDVSETGKVTYSSVEVLFDGVDDVADNYAEVTSTVVVRVGDRVVVTIKDHFAYISSNFSTESIGAFTADYKDPSHVGQLQHDSNPSDPNSGYYLTMRGVQSNPGSGVIFVTDKSKPLSDLIGRYPWRLNGDGSARFGKMSISKDGDISLGDGMEILDYHYTDASGNEIQNGGGIQFNPDSDGNTSMITSSNILLSHANSRVFSAMYNGQLNPASYVKDFNSNLSHPTLGVQCGLIGNGTIGTLPANGTNPATYSVVFNTPFSRAPLVFLQIARGTAEVNDGLVCAYVSATSATGFTVRLVNSSGSDKTGIGVRWVAFDYLQTD